MTHFTTCDIKCFQRCGLSTPLVFFRNQTKEIYQWKLTQFHSLRCVKLRSSTLPKETIKFWLNLLIETTLFLLWTATQRLMAVLSKRESVPPFGSLPCLRTRVDYINNKRMSDKRLRMMTRWCHLRYRISCPRCTVRFADGPTSVFADPLQKETQYEAPLLQFRFNKW